ncbi:MAG TPA: hypothetical protein VFU48_10710, partial [Nitrospira sp.]|nr:hypothetical protein [Nitrospira sp.]
LPNVDTSNGADPRYKDQEIELCCFQTVGAEFIIVDACENTIEYACTTQEAITYYLLNIIFVLFHF